MAETPKALLALLPEEQNPKNPRTLFSSVVSLNLRGHSSRAFLICGQPESAGHSSRAFLICGQPESAGRSCRALPICGQPESAGAIPSRAFLICGQPESAGAIPARLSSSAVSLNLRGPFQQGFPHLWSA
jgi:hypothetical protein